MLQKIYFAKVQKAFKNINWKLLLFLLLFLNVKLVVKIAAIALIYLLQFNFKFSFRWRDSRLPIFYLFAVGIAIINWFLLKGFQNINYTVSLLIGLSFWLLCIFAMHQVKLSVEQNSEEVIHQTITLFFLLNALASLAVLAIIILKTGALNPYLYQGDYQKYFIGTGDYIKGISFDTSTTNAVLNGFGVIYFLSKKNVKMMMLCMVILLLTGSNVTNFLLAAVLLFMFIFRTDRDQKSLVFVCLLFLVIFLTKISPQNNSYVSNYLETAFNPGKTNVEENQIPITLRPDSTLTREGRKEKIATLYLDSLYRLRNEELNKMNVHPASFIYKSEMPKPDINTAPYQHKSFVTPAEKNMNEFIQQHPKELILSTDPDFNSKMPGKILAYKQTLDFFKFHPLKIITGTGTGNFSSKLAFKTTGLNIAGGYPQKFIYINDDFLKNHLDSYLNYFTKPDGFHSVANNPNSVYDQLLTEYGVLGLFAFFIFYLGFFLKDFKKLTYGIPLILFLSGIFFVDYWFEQLSIVVFFELLLFLNMKEEAGK